MYNPLSGIASNARGGWEKGGALLQGQGQQPHMGLWGGVPGPQALLSPHDLQHQPRGRAARSRARRPHAWRASHSGMCQPTGTALFRLCVPVYSHFLGTVLSSVSGRRLFCKCLSGSDPMGRMSARCSKGLCAARRSLCCGPHPSAHPLQRKRDTTRWARWWQTNCRNHCAIHLTAAAAATAATVTTAADADADAATAAADSDAAAYNCWWW